jgi:hypothetical protein
MLHQSPTVRDDTVMMEKLRIIHNMARSGSTLMCKCLGCMEGVVLLSEIHPLGMQYFSPLKQAKDWYGLLTQPEVDALQQPDATNFSEAIALIERRCRVRGLALIVRDWAHLDYTGQPFTTPTYTPLLFKELAGSFDILRIATARDPVTQWKSLSQLGLIQAAIQSGKFDLEQFLLGYRRYAELCAITGFIRYEDFLRKPELPLRKLCEQLQVRFDPGFIRKWSQYTSITGDINNFRQSDKIKKSASKPIDPTLRKRFLDNTDYCHASKLLGYDFLRK